MLKTTWRKITQTDLWSDEKKLELFGYRDAAYVWRKKGEMYTPNNTVSTVKHGGRSPVGGRNHKERKT